MNCKFLLDVGLLPCSAWGYNAPRTDTHIVANIDLAPTIAEWAGVSAPDSVDGLSMVPILKDPSSTWRKDILFEHWPTEEGVGSMIITTRTKAKK